MFNNNIVFSMHVHKQLILGIVLLCHLGIVSYIYKNN